ncbi:hypothetical protein NLX85_16120 [Micromonospora sp. A3M-1-15]|uniref:hypothetical protein n=1 Tax=Micromonospora sp. A3M-1-15 TaxID=2962035 RepID=UPI0020B83677|nr:hypothetical protein [Micromonospora sp. A3M-1-15]MCP3784895.1 hypothetical protein [Micromonospora sp. A3M-1-15]
MARTRRRRIRVDGVDYRWTVRHADPGQVVVRVWHAATGRGTGLEVLVAFDDPWLNFGPIVTAPSDRVAEVFALEPVTPRLVAALVQAAVAAGWPAHRGGGPRRLVLDRSRERLEPAPGTTTDGGAETRVRVTPTGP